MGLYESLGFKRMNPYYDNWKESRFGLTERDVQRDFITGIVPRQVAEAVRIGVRRYFRKVLDKNAVTKVHLIRV